jgi:3'(2'), 5'-bisphosphate nucleotidase
MPINATSYIDDVWRAIRQAVIPAVRYYRSDLKSLNVEIKKDKTFLTEADTNVQSAIVQAIRQYDPITPIVAEEMYNSFLHSEGKTHGDDSTASAWIIDPIDGTSQFIRPDGREFCTAVALVQNGMPSLALVIAHEATQGHSAVCISADVAARVVEADNEIFAQDVLDGSPTWWASLGQDSRNVSPEIGRYLTGRGYKVKRTTTSQTLDILRAAGPILPPGTFRPFDLFYREHQKVWDGVPGMCVALAAGKSVRTLHPDAHLPLKERFLRDVEPKFRSTIIGRASLVDQVSQDVSLDTGRDIT